MKENCPKRKWTSGFTLIELLVVIAIIAILAAILESIGMEYDTGILLLIIRKVASEMILISAH